MKRYECQLKSLLGVMAKGYGIGYVVSFLLGLLIDSGFQLEVIWIALALDLIVGSVICIFMMSSTGTQNGLANACVNMGRSMIGGLFSAGFGWGIGMVFFVVKLIIFGIIALVLFTFAGISFPLTVIYTLIMYLVERFKGEIDDNLADTLDKIVPVASFVITAIIIYLVIKAG